MSDLELLASPDAAALAAVLRAVLLEVHFDRVNHDLRLPAFGGDYLIRPFPLPGSPVDLPDMKTRLRRVVKSSGHDSERRFAKRIQLAFRLLMFGEPVDREQASDLFGAGRQEWIDVAIRIGLFVHDGPNQLRMNGLSIYSRRLPKGDALCLLADTPSHFNGRSRPLRVYAGADSYELMARVSGAEMIRGYAVEMGSGSGIQSITALKTHPAIVKAVGVERDRRAMHVSLFNAALNGVADRYVAVPDAEPLRELLGRHEVVLGMSNPPFLALPSSVRIDEESRALLPDVSEIRDTPDGGVVDVERSFPQAGWGGQDGLDVTRQFIDVFRSVGARRILIYSQFAGDERAPSLIQKHVERIGEFEFAFEPVGDNGAIGKKPVQTASESALTLARLLTAALLEKQNPQRIRLAIREGGPEHGLMKKIAAQIEASYRQLGISHFHDGFVHLVRRG